MIEQLHRTIVHVRTLLKKVIRMPNVKFNNGTQITAGHLKVSLWIIGGLIGAVIALVCFIYLDFTFRQDSRDQKQDEQLEKIYNEVVFSTTINTITLDIIKDYLEQRDSIRNYFDERVNLKYQILKSKTRGGFIEPKTDVNNLAIE